MSDTLSLDIRTVLAWLRQESHPLSTIADASRLEYLASLTHGSGAGQANLLWYDERELAPAAHDDLDLTALTSSLFGGDVVASFATIKAVLVVNTATTPEEDLTLGGAGSGGHAWAAPFADDQGSLLAVAADSMILLVNKPAGWPVTNGSADTLRLANNGSGNVTARIVIVGTSA